MQNLLQRPEYLLRPGNLFRRLVLRRVLRGREVVVRLKTGCEIAVREGEFIGNNIINAGCHDAPLGELLWRLIRRGDACIDVGANIGYVTLLMAAQCGSSGRCLAYEADPSLFSKLVGNVNRNGFSHVSMVNAAVSDREGVICFQRAEGLNAGLGRVVEDGASGSFRLPAIKLDEHLARLERVRVVKIDVEGHELRVLKGMSAALEARKVDTLVWEEHGGAGAESLACLRKSGYTIFRLARRLRGPRLVPPEMALTENLEPNFVATLDPSGLEKLVSKPGWNIF